MTMPRRWVNARVTFVVPLAVVGVGATAEQKQAVVGDLVEEFIEALPDHLAQNVITGEWEDAGELPPLEPPADDFDERPSGRSWMG